MAVFRVLNGKAFLVKSITPDQEKEFMKLNPKGFVKVESYPPCRFETWKYNPKTGEIEIDQERFVERAVKTFLEELKNLEFQIIQMVLSNYGYKDLGDVLFWANQDPSDPEPKALLEWYKAYDDAIWKEIDSLSGKTFKELQNYDPLKVEKQIFEGTKDKLPPLED
ncbi:MAG: hypothetical protein ABGX24_05350 [Aquificota bacterium]|jgi:hypothetical protein